jgi:hypothetical protein
MRWSRLRLQLARSQPLLHQMWCLRERPSQWCHCHLGWQQQLMGQQKHILAYQQHLLGGQKHRKHLLKALPML